MPKASVDRPACAGSRPAASSTSKTMTSVSAPIGTSVSSGVDRVAQPLAVQEVLDRPDRPEERPDPAHVEVAEWPAPSRPVRSQIRANKSTDHDSTSVRARLGDQQLAGDRAASDDEDGWEHARRQHGEGHRSDRDVDQAADRRVHTGLYSAAARSPTTAAFVPLSARRNFRSCAAGPRRGACPRSAGTWAGRSRRGTAHRRRRRRA